MQKKFRHQLIAAAGMTIVLFGTTFSRAAQTPSKSEPSVLHVSASSTVKAKPDRALISIGVLTQSSKADEASAQNAKQSSAVIAQVKKILGSKGEIKTANYQLSPVYERRPTKEPQVSGYSAANTVEVSVDDLDLVGKIIDAASQSGANTVQGLQFILKDDSALRKQALAEAVAKAKLKADAMADAAGVKIVGILNLDETGESFHPMMARSFGAEMGVQKMAAPTPIEAGDLDVTAGINIAFEITPK